MTTENMTVDAPKHPLPALTTYELRDYRRELERAIALFDQKTSVPAARSLMQALLDGVIAEQDDRRKLAGVRS